MASKKGGQPKSAPQAPVLSLSKASDMNMMVLKRIDSQIEEILANAGHVCLYRMSVDDQQWQRKNIEGSLFLIKRRTQPRFQMLVLNKLSTDNYIETVHGGLEMETNPPYLMYTHGNDEIHGIWFYEESDLQRLSALLQKILNQLPKPDPAAAAAAAGPAAVPGPAPVVVQQVATEPLPLPQAPAAAAAAAAAGDGDAFWDRSVHVTEETLPASQHLVPNSSLLAEPQAAQPSSSAGGLQGLLKAAQQKHTVAQRAPQPAPLPHAPVPNSTSAPAESAGAPPAAAAPAGGLLLTPAFFEQAQGKQAAAAEQPAAAVEATPPVAAPAPNGTTSSSSSSSALHKLLSSARRAAPLAGANAGSSSAPLATPQPPLGVISHDAQRDKLKAALIRLANNDVFVEALAQELRTVGLLQ